MGKVPWGPYQNGEIPRSALADFGNGQLGHPAMVYWWKKMDAACFAATGHHLQVTEGYRSLGIAPDQRVLVAARTSDRTPNQWFQVGRRNRGQTPSAAIPGTSLHGDALAEDDAAYIYAAVWNWLLLHAREYGFAVNTIKSERWHIVYVGSLTIPTAPAVVITGEKNMDIALSTDQKGIVFRTVEGKKTWYTAISPLGDSQIHTGYTSKIKPYITAYGPAVNGTPADVAKAQADRKAAVQRVVYVEGDLWLAIASIAEQNEYAAIIATLRGVKTYTPKQFTPSRFALLKRTVPTAK